MNLDMTNLPSDDVGNFDEKCNISNQTYFSNKLAPPSLSMSNSDFIFIENATQGDDSRPNPIYKTIGSPLQMPIKRQRYGSQSSKPAKTQIDAASENLSSELLTPSRIIKTSKSQRNIKFMN